MTADWMKEFPSVFVTKNYHGNKELAKNYDGEGRKLLYELKNQMRLGNLQQLRMTRYFDNGLVIVAKSVFGHDTIDITHPAGGFPSTCDLTLIDVPSVIAPSRWCLEGICDGDVLGVDYHKTYYRLNVQDCGDCQLQWTICEQGEIIVPVGTPNSCWPFFFEDDIIPHVDDVYTPLNHCLYSLSRCHTEIIGRGEDSGGTYILWKAYTEWSNVGPLVVTFSRTGFGYFQLKPFIMNPKNLTSELCSDEEIILVDCCLKPEIERTVTLYWAAQDNNCAMKPFFFYGSLIFCEVPSSLGLWAFYNFAVTQNATFYMLPQLKGGCLPFTWTLEGKGILQIYDETVGDIVTYEPWHEDGSVISDEEMGCAPITIKVRDRCGTEDTMVADCCATHELGFPLGITYTSLIMGFSQTQELVNSGGCPPYSWSISGGGTLSESSTMEGPVILTSPASNPNCGNKGTVTITDCCGDSASIQIAYSNGSPDPAMENLIGTMCECRHYGEADCTNNPAFECIWFYDSRISYDCMSNPLTYSYMYYGTPAPIGFKNVSSDPGCGPVLGLLDATFPCGGDLCQIYRFKDCGFYDNRTADQKAAGCCPINPVTGLPM